MRRNFIWSSAIALAVAISSVSHADVIEFSFEDRGSSFITPSSETFGSQIENTELAGLAANPVTITLNPDTGSSACLLYTSPSPRDRQKSRMPSSA